MVDFDITVEELKQKLDIGEDLFILDIRETHERQICRLEDHALIPMGRLPMNLRKLNKEDHIIVYCRTGRRSIGATQYLRQSGFTKARNLKDGIRAWSERIDRSVPTY